MQTPKSPLWYFKSPLRFIKSIFFVFLAILVAIIVLLWQASPKDFYGEKKITIARGDSVSRVSTNLKQRGLIRSENMFKAFVYIFGDESKIMPGDYVFVKPEPVFIIALDILNIKNRTNIYRLTIPEGFSNYQISKAVRLSDPLFNDQSFRDLADQKEGYLFPDTYIFEKQTLPEDIIRKMTENFDNKTRILFSSDLHGKSKEDILIMASIIEKESNNFEEQKIISGILWKRIKEGIPLQVDAPFQYLLGKASSELTMADLKSNSPYNTYKNRGLTPTPIGNPGLNAIYSAINPVSSKYYFYLHGTDGQIHYAKTFAEHLQNKNLYIK